MTRNVRDSKLETRTGRLKCPIGVYQWNSLGEGRYIGYRRTKKGYGVWFGRVVMTNGRKSFDKLGMADDYLDADGKDVLTFTMATDKLRDLEKSLKRGKLQDPISVSKAASHYLEWYKDHRKAFRETSATVEAHILPSFGNKLVSDLTTKDIRDWMNKLATQPARKRRKIGEPIQYREKPSTPDEKRARKATANRILTVFKAILNKAFQDDLVMDDTAWRRVKPFENTDEPITRFLTKDEAGRLINVCRPDFRLLVKAALFTGARYSELVGMMVGDINTDNKSLFVRPSKSGKGRHVPLNKEGLNFFTRQTLGRNSDEILFLKNNGKPWGKNHHVRDLQDACEGAMINPPVSFHEFRHTYASLLAQNGADLLTISKLLGHADTRITSRHYAHLCDKTLADAVNEHLPDFGHEHDAKVVPLKHRK